MMPPFRGGPSKPRPIRRFAVRHAPGDERGPIFGNASKAVVNGAGLSTGVPAAGCRCHGSRAQQAPSEGRHDLRASGATMHSPWRHNFSA